MKCVLKRISLFYFFILCFAGCKNVLLPQPDLGNRNVVGGETEWGAPLNVSATQGIKGKIDLRWSPVKNAARYYVYKADNPFSEYNQIAETADSTASFSVPVPPGTDVYFKIKAADNNENESDFSTAVRGTSLAKPIISDIVGDAEAGDTSATVYWYMNNLESYKNSVRYDVVCLDSQEKELFRIAVSSEKTEALVSGLVPNTPYKYKVEAYNIADQTQVESSDVTDAQTARRLRPDAPENLKIEKGAYADKVTIKFTLPGTVDVVVGKKRYEPKPLYFKIFRKFAEEDDSAFVPLCSYFGSDEKSAENAGSTGKSFASEYTPGDEVSYEDDKVERGRQYVYKIQSYADDVPNIITSEKSFATDSGWAVAPISYKMNDAVYKNDEGNTEHIAATLTGTLNFDSQGLDDDYVYDLNCVLNKIGNDDESQKEETKIKLKESLSRSELENFSYLVKLDDENSPGEGIYVFEIVVKNKISDWTETIRSSNSRYIVSDLNPLTVEDASVKDGFIDKFEIVFKRNPAITYKIEYKFKDDEPKADYKLAKEIKSENAESESPYDFIFTETDDKSYKVKSGDVLKLKITPFNSEGRPGRPEEFEGCDFYTLGTPKVTFDAENAEQDSVKVTWQKIEKATSYEISYEYDGVDSNSSILRENKSVTFADAYNADKKAIVVQNIETESANSNELSCVFEKPAGFDYMQYSGKQMKITVKAFNKNIKNESGSPVFTEGNASAYTLGPAAVQVAASVAEKEDSIDVKWKKTPGAAGYLIARTRYGLSNSNDSKSEDGDFAYFYDEKNEKLQVLGQEIAEFPFAKVTFEESDGKFTLSDKYFDSTTIPNDDFARKFYIEQDKIAWGYPYRYQVFPVKESVQSFNKKDSATVTVGNVTFLDADKNYSVGSAIGYGLNLVADKATSGATQNIKWDKPYKAQRPVVYRRAAGESGNFELFRDDSSEISDENAKMAIRDNYYGAFEYLVKYYHNGESLDDSVSPPKSLLAEIAKRTTQYETPGGTKTEQDNKGYLLTIENFLAEIDETKDYYEKISWKSWNYNTRAVGPDSMMIFIQNNNIGKDPKPAVEIVEANAEKTINYVGSDIDGEKLGSASIRIKPKSVSDNGAGTAATDGLLKVLRDYKHNYTFELRRAGDKEPIIVPNVDYDNDYKKTAYRQETPQEFARIANLVLAEGLNRVNGTDWSTGFFGREEKTDFGTVKAKSDFGVKNWDITYTNYEPSFQTKTGETTKIAKVNGTFNPKTGASNQYPQSYEGGSVTITLSGGTKKTGTIQFNTLKPNSGTMTVTFDGKTESFSADNYFNTPLPFSGGGYKYNDEQWQ